MALDTLENEILTLRDRAKVLQRSHSNATREIESDTSLSDTGKEDAKKRSYDSHRASLRELRQREEQLINNKIQELQGRIDSTSGRTAADIIAFRDAQDRADRIAKPEQAQPMLERAIRQNDTSLAHAIFRRAIENGWRSVQDAFTAHRPELTDVVRDLNRLNALKENSFERTMQYAFILR